MSPTTLDGKPLTVAGRPGYVTTDPKWLRYDLSSTTELLGEANDHARRVGGAGHHHGSAEGRGCEGAVRLADIVRAYFS